jgi:hypothetical protein
LGNEDFLNILLSGSDDEPPMTEKDYRKIYSKMKVVAEKKWGTGFAFWAFILQQIGNFFTRIS